MIMMNSLKKYCKDVTFLWLIMICILFHSYTESDLIVDSLVENTDNYHEIDKTMWNEKKNQNEYFLKFFDNVNITIYCNNNYDDYIANTTYCNPIDHNVNSSSLSVSSSNVSVDNKCNLRSAWNTCRFMFNNISCMI
jgi:uncharacterized protein YpuA (DUF1002 family)